MIGIVGYSLAESVWHLHTKTSHFEEGSRVWIVGIEPSIRIACGMVWRDIVWCMIIHHDMSWRRMPLCGDGIV